MTLPNFFIIGAAKCATTSLASLLEQHPEVGIVRGKEPHFFSYDQQYARGLGYYNELFTHCSDKPAIGDASTSYSRIRQHPQVIERIAKHIDQPKIIYMVRDPIKRIESAYIEQMTEPQNRHIKSINQAVNERPMMVDSSRYWETFRAYQKQFGKKSIRVIFFEDYLTNQEAAFANTCAFLGIDESFTPNLDQQNENSRSEASKKLGDGVTVDAKWNKKTLLSVKKTLHTDSQRLLHYFEKPSDFWRA